jgi:hypothetical protein
MSSGSLASVPASTRGAPCEFAVEAAQGRTRLAQLRDQRRRTSAMRRCLACAVWRIGIQHPTNRQQTVATVAGDNLVGATAGHTHAASTSWTHTPTGRRRGPLGHDHRLRPRRGRCLRHRRLRNGPARTARVRGLPSADTARRRPRAPHAGFPARRDRLTRRRGLSATRLRLVDHDGGFRALPSTDDPRRIGLSVFTGDVEGLPTSAWSPGEINPHTKEPSCLSPPSSH